MPDTLVSSFENDCFTLKCVPPMVMKDDGLGLTVLPGVEYVFLVCSTMVF